MSDYCAPAPYQEPPGLYFKVHETNIVHPFIPADPPPDYEIPDDVTYEGDLGPYFDPFFGPVINFHVTGVNTVRQTKTLKLIGPVPIKITWTHHSWTGTVDTVTHPPGITLTKEEPEYTWDTGFEDPGADADPEDYSAEYDDSFIAHRAV
jgi:hypothetical protein